MAAQGGGTKRDATQTLQRLWWRRGAEKRDDTQTSQRLWRRWGAKKEMTLKLRSSCGVAGDAQGGGENRNDPQISQRMWRRRGAGCARVEDGERFFLIEIKIFFDPCVRRLQKGQIGKDSF